MAWTLYEIFARPWCRSEGGGGLDGVSDEALDRIADLGPDAVWLMGAWTVGRASRDAALAHPGLASAFRAALPDFTEEDVHGSPFSVARYEASPDLGGDEALDRFRRRLEHRGLGLVLDFVPNHTARDHERVARRPHLYVRGTPGQAADDPGSFFLPPGGGDPVAHGRDPYFPGWTDTAQVDYRLAEAREAAAGDLEAAAARCDGLRCDMAMLALAPVFASTWKACPPRGAQAEGEFWPAALDRVRDRRPGFLFVAEAYWGLEDRLSEMGFDLVYDKGLCDALVRRDPRALDRAVGRDPGRLERGLRFIENHDEERAASAFPDTALPAAAVAALTLPGGRLLHQGQETGARVRLPVQLARRPAEGPDPAAVRLHQALLPVLASDTLRRGRWTRLPSDPAGPHDSAHGNVLAWLWSDGGGGRVLCAVNPSDGPGRARLPLPPAGLGGRTTVWRDLLDGTEYVRSGDELCRPGLYVDRGPGEAHVLRLVEARAPGAPAVIPRPPP